MDTNFRQFNISKELIDAINEIGFVKATPIQQKLIPSIINKKDVVGQSQTGSGKTHTFLIPIFNNIVTNSGNTQAIVLSPSRELANQIFQAAKKINNFLPKDFQKNIQLAVGGTEKSKLVDQLQKKQPDLLIGTPGRIKDVIEEKILDISSVKILVIDEADMTLDMGFLPDADYIASALPKDLQMLAFSATVPQKLKIFFEKYMNNPIIGNIPTSAVVADTISNYIIATKSKSKNDVILQLIKRRGTFLTLIFVNTKERADELTSFLKNQGISVAEIHGGVEPRKRKQVMQRINKNDFQFVVATDLASRGIDIEGVSEVINDDVPNNLEFFVHRVGRTGRNGMPGVAITLYGPDDEAKIDQLEATGIAFQTKKIDENGALIDAKNRQSRKLRKSTSSSLSGEILGEIQKKKQKVKPGYKRQINSSIKRKRMSDARVQKRNQKKHGA